MKMKMKILAKNTEKPQVTSSVSDIIWKNRCHVFFLVSHQFSTKFSKRNIKCRLGVRVTLSAVGTYTWQLLNLQKLRRDQTSSNELFRPRRSDEGGSHVPGALHHRHPRVYPRRRVRPDHQEGGALAEEVRDGGAVCQRDSRRQVGGEGQRLAHFFGVQVSKILGCASRCFA